MYVCGFFGVEMIDDGQNNYIRMLKFLDNHQTSNKKSPIKYQPEMAYGISLESPAQFQTPYTLVHHSTYLNPYLHFEPQRQASLPKQKMSNINPKWTAKINLNMVQEHKILQSQPEIFSNKIPSRYRQSYYNQLANNKNRFMITKGQFSNFIQKNNHYKSVGPLHGAERTQQRIIKTKQSVWLMRDKSKHNSSMYSIPINYNHSINSQLKKSASIFSKNSSILTQKTRIRLNRQTFHHKFKNSLEERKKDTGVNYKFELPKLTTDYINPHRPLVTIYGRDQKQNTAETQSIHNLQLFQQTLSRKFK